jgi:hypothetical protein
MINNGIVKSTAQIALWSLVITAILFGTQYFLAPLDPSTPPVRHVITDTIVVKETETISFQREGDWVLATFLDGTICIHDKREIEPVCQRAVKGPTL